MRNLRDSSLLIPVILGFSALSGSQIYAEPANVYAFQSQFGSQDSVNYTGQTFRQLLIHDLTAFVKSLEAGGYGGIESDLMTAFNSYYRYQYDRDSDAPGAINGFQSFSFRPKNRGWHAAIDC